MRLPTREKLLETIDGIARRSKSRPISQFTVDFIDLKGTLLDENIELYTLDDLMATLMDKSLCYRVVKVNSGSVWCRGMWGICVIITLMQDGEYQTNIDADLMEKLLEMTIIPNEEKGQ